MRRFARNMSFNILYTYSKSIDDSSTFGGVGNVVAQNAFDLSAERGLSSFDRTARAESELRSQHAHAGQLVEAQLDVERIGAA